jgi:predicted nucleotidyltransferase
VRAAHRAPITFLALEGKLEKLLKTKVDLVTKQALRPELMERILSEVVYV